MSRILPGKLACKDDKRCGSSDAMRQYENGSYYCFSCQSYFPADGDTNSRSAYSSDDDSDKNNKRYSRMNDSAELLEIAEYDIRGAQDRGVTKAIAEHFGVRVEYNSSKQIVARFYPYGVSEISGYKCRQLPKDFRAVGKLEGLFGQRLFNSGRRLIITEGEEDALIVAQSALEMYKQVYPVVSLSSASNTKEVLKQRDWVLGFDEIIIWCDDDEPGRQAAEEIARILVGGGKKILIAKSNHKDASDTYVKASERNDVGSLIQGPGAKAVMDAVFRAAPWSPSGIISGANTWDAYKRDLGEFIPFCPALEEFNRTNYGRKMGSITMFTSGTGMGKTSLLKEDQYHLLMTRPKEERLGVLSLEESVHEAVGNIMAIHANKRILLPDVRAAMTDEEERRLWEETMADDRFMFLDHQGAVDDDSLIARMEYMALSGCKYLYLDHITIAVSEGGSSDDVNKATDKLMSDLLKLAKRRDIWIGVVCHLRKMGTQQKSFEEGAVPTDDDLKGSGALKQVPMQIIAISRNKLEEDEFKRSVSHVWCLKDRFTGRTGPKGAYRFDDATGRLIVRSSDDFVPTL
jgi:twinkle protein